MISRKAYASRAHTLEKISSRHLSKWGWRCDVIELATGDEVTHTPSAINNVAADFRPRHQDAGVKKPKKPKLHYFDLLRVCCRPTSCCTTTKWKDTRRAQTSANAMQIFSVVFARWQHYIRLCSICTRTLVIKLFFRFSSFSSIISFRRFKLQFLQFDVL